MVAVLRCCTPAQPQAAPQIPGCTDVRPLDRPGGHESRRRTGPHSQGQASGGATAGTGMEGPRLRAHRSERGGLTSRPPWVPAEPSRRGRFRPVPRRVRRRPTGWELGRVMSGRPAYAFLGFSPSKSQTNRNLARCQRRKAINTQRPGG